MLANEDDLLYECRNDTDSSTRRTLGEARSDEEELIPLIVFSSFSTDDCTERASVTTTIVVDLFQTLCNHSATTAEVEHKSVQKGVHSYHDDESSMCTLTTVGSSLSSQEIRFLWPDDLDNKVDHDTGPVPFVSISASECTRSLPLFEEEQQGDNDFFTEGFVPVGDLPRIY